MLAVAPFFFLWYFKFHMLPNMSFEFYHFVLIY